MGLRARLLGGGDASIARARRPEALAASMDEPPKEGLDWLGRRPGRNAPLVYRALLRLGEVSLIGVCRLRVQVHGREHLPAAGYILVALLHRSWIDPLVVIRALPTEPRVWFLGSGPTAFDRRWKERLLRHKGILPVWRGGTRLDAHVEAARAVIDEKAVLALFIEGAIGGPPDGPGRLRDGAALLALRTNAPIVPFALCGAEELYRGKRISAHILAPTTVAELVGGGADIPRPAPGSRDEMRAAKALTAAMSERIAAAIADYYPATVDPADYPRRWPWLTRLMR
jgi:1-acyl-sn-glycerol-3-phosphate acyltransferase